MKNSSIVETLGNTELLELEKAAFLCSSKYSSASVLKSYDWATEQQKSGNCVISGFHSPLEKDVLDILLRGEQPVIMVLARGLYQRPSKKLLQHLKSGRLLIVTPFDCSVTYITKETAEVRNRLVITLADEIVVAHMTKGGQLEKILNTANKKTTILDK
ncbi:DNA-processing protein DprA [Caproiciproducens galactitolivorans]|uniref:DNA-processing protein DprA n=1 Tax=Caproiciproducens galactitolivorans TaxID=642589 RepID=A0ABT4BUA7_9FIRM|nr:DNA-processing protein DprA [Caproiciproducens galactitolivorans]MCY1714483.1 DNA-processing protein DprA [Caproiciproducens galactitolivorans]